METRNDKYRDYRASLIKEGSQYYSGKARMETRTLPISEVINKSDIQDEPLEKKYNHYKVKKVIAYVGIVFATIAIIAGIVIFGVYVFRGN